jgi:hypothetical protein
LKQGDPISQLSAQLLSSIIKVILDAIPKLSNRTFVFKLLVNVQNYTLGNGCIMLAQNASLHEDTSWFASVSVRRYCFTP